MSKQMVRVILDVELEKNITDLAVKIAGRAYTIQGVSNCEVVHVGANFDMGTPYGLQPVPKPTFWFLVKETFLRVLMFR
jgi:hypothetical protein